MKRLKPFEIFEAIIGIGFSVIFALIFCCFFACCKTITKTQKSSTNTTTVTKTDSTEKKSYSFTEVSKTDSTLSTTVTTVTIDSVDTYDYVGGVHGWDIENSNIIGRIIKAKGVAILTTTITQSAVKESNIQNDSAITNNNIHSDSTHAVVTKLDDTKKQAHPIKIAVGFGILLIIVICVLALIYRKYLF